MKAKPGNKKIDINQIEGVDLNQEVQLIKGQILCNQLVEEHIFNKQIYDHFEPNYYEYWSQRYFIVKPNQLHNTQSSAINLLFLCNQSLNQDAQSCIPPYFDDQKRNNNVNIILLEMRYHGKSQPFLSRNLGKDTLSYQTIQQNIADIPHFIHHLKINSIISSNSTTIVIGEKVSGSIGIWSRQKYGHLIDSAIGFNSLLASLSFQEYNLHTIQILEEQHPLCNQALTSFLSYINLNLSDPLLAQQLIKSFFFQYTITNDLFLYYIYDLIQYNIETSLDRSTFCTLISNKNETEILNTIIDIASKQSKSLFDIPQFNVNQNNQTNSQDNNNNIKNENYHLNGNSNIANLRLGCSDFGFERFTDGQQQQQQQNEQQQRNVLFKKIPQIIFKQICKVLFNQSYLPRVDKLQIEMGGQEYINTSTHFINNLNDMSSFGYKKCETQQQFNTKKNKNKQKNSKKQSKVKQLDLTELNSLSCIEYNQSDEHLLKDKINRIISLYLQKQTNLNLSKLSSSQNKKNKQSKTQKTKNNKDQAKIKIKKSSSQNESNLKKEKQK